MSTRDHGPSRAPGDRAPGNRARPGATRHLPVRPGLAVLALMLALMLVPPAAAEPPAPVWQWPLAPPHRVVQPFDGPATPYAAGHRGVDLSGGSTDVRTVDDGVVRFAGTVAGRPVVSVLHADGLISTYEPVAAVVTAGEHVTAGTVIGTLQNSAASHCAPAACLHLGARRDRTYTDPMLLLGARGPSVLLPLDGADAVGSAAASADANVDAGAGARPSAVAKLAAGPTPAGTPRSRQPAGRAVLAP